MKKRFFNTAVAVAAAMSLSVCAFAEAAEPGVSLPGFSGLPGASDAAVGAAVGTATVKLGSDEGVLVTGPASAFKPATYVYLGVSLSTSVDAETEAYVKDCVETALANHKPTLEDDKMTVNSAVRLKLYNQDKEEIQPNSALTVKIAYDGESNIAAYIDAEGNVEWIKLDTTSKIMTFKTSHFSDFYFLKLREGLVETLTNTDGGLAPGEVTTTTSGSTNPGGGISGPGNETTTTQAPEAEATTTQAPAVTTTTTAAPSGSDDKPNNDDNTPSGGDTTNGPANEDNSNVGNDGAGNGPDKNQATGVVLAVVPAAIAAAAVVISKKRK